MLRRQEIDFGSFTDDASTPNHFTPGNFGDILADKLTRTSPAAPNTGKYSQIVGYEGTAPDSYDLCYINRSGAAPVKEYYSYVSDGTGQYNFELTGDDDTTFDEDYYLSFYVPIPPDYIDGLYFYQISGNPTLTNTDKHKTAQRDSNSLSRNVLIADLYEQTTNEYTVTSNQGNEPIMSPSNNSLHVRTASTITLKNSRSGSFITGATLQHAFNIVPSRYYSDSSVRSDIVGCTGVTAKYAVTQNGYVQNTPTTINASNAQVKSSFISVPTTNDLISGLTDNSNTSRSVTIYADVDIPFAPTSISDEFPQRSNEEQNVGVNVTASSNLAYSADRLDYTSITKAFDPNSNYYYIESVNLAMLNYYAETKKDVDDYDGSRSNNMSLLGVNGRLGTSQYALMQISTKADYNVGILDNYADGDKVRLTLTLNKKTDVPDDPDNPTSIIRAEYQEVPISTYLQNISVKSGDVTFTLESSTANKLVYIADAQGSGNDGKCEVDDAGFYHFDILFDVKTRDNFTDYANYQVNLQAELYKTNSETHELECVGNSFAKDYVVYTNAKVNNSVIQQGAPSP